MDVRMPDGTIVRGVPDNITQDELLGRYNAYLGKSSPQPAAQEKPILEPPPSDEELEAPPGGFVTRGGAAIVPPRIGRRQQPAEVPAPIPKRETTEMRQWEPTMWERFLGMLPGDRAKAANEYTARKIAQEQNISVDEAYRRMKEAVGVSGIGGRPSGQPMFNPEGRAPVQAAAEAVPYVAEGVLDIPKGMAEAALRAYRSGDIESSVDSGMVDRMISYLGDESKEIFIPNIADRLGVDKKDPNYQGFMGLGKSLGYSLTTMVASATAGVAALPLTGPAGAVAAGMGTSGAVAYRASKDEFLDRLREKLNKDSKKVFGRNMSDEEWSAAKEKFNIEAVKYGAWEAVPEAISNAIFLKAFSAPAAAARGSKLANYIEKANSFAVENITETATGLGQNAAELKAGLTKDELTIADAFKQQFIQTVLTMGVTAGGMKGIDYANQFYNEQVLPKINPASALAKAIQADLQSIGYTPAGLRMRSVTEGMPMDAFVRQPAAKTTEKGAEPPEEAPPEAPPRAVEPPEERVEPVIGAGVAPEAEPPAEGRVEPSVGLIPGTPSAEDVAFLPEELPTKTAVTPVTPEEAEPQVTPVTAAPVAEEEKKPTEEAPAEEAPAEETPAAEQKPVGEFILQNRDRSSQASREQMESIARAPDYDRAGFSNTPDGAPIVAFGDIPISHLGRIGKVTTASGRKIPVQYGVVEADEIITSNDVGGNPDERYGDRNVSGMRAIAGNGRVAGIREGFRRGTAEPYRQAMMEDDLHKVNPEVIAGMRNPVLVRMMPEESLTANIGDELNQGTMLELSAAEQAKNDLNRVDFDNLAFSEDGEITPQSVNQFINAMPLEERGKLTEKGLPTRQAYQRLENAIFARAYQDDALIALFAQAKDPEARLLIGALMQVAPAMARLEGAGNLDIRGIVTDAAKMIISGKRRGLKLADIAKQADITTDPDALIIVQLFADNPRSNKPAIEALTNAANIAYQEFIKPEEGLFGAQPKISRKELLTRLGGKNEPSTMEGPKGAGAAPSDVERKAKPSAAAVPVAGEELALVGETEEEIKAREAEAEKRAKEKREKEKEAERKEAADREEFVLTGSTRPADEAAARGQQDLLSAAEPELSPEYKAALDKSNEAIRKFTAIQQAYRKREIGDEEFLAGRREYDKAMEEFDLAEREERERPAKPATQKQVKEETQYIEGIAKDQLEAMAQDFLVGDLVRFGNVPGVVIGVEGDYVRFRPDTAKSPKAYQRLPKSSLTFVDRPDRTSEVSYSKAQDQKFGEEDGQLKADMGNLIQLLGANMYASSLSDVTIKELLQNSFDAVKGATVSVNAEGKKIKPLYKSGTIEIALNYDDRTITIKDDARGMTPEIVRNAFFTVAGSDKSDLPPNMRSGGLGLAKMGFMLGSERLQLDTVRDGVRVTVDTTAKDIANNNFKLKKSPAPKDEHGTTITVKIPESYIDPKTGDSKNIYFPISLDSVRPLKTPLIGPVEVTTSMTVFGSTEKDVLPIGLNFPKEKYTQFKANFEWGSADIYFSIDRNPGKRWQINHQVLSSGVYQFSPEFMINDEMIPYDIIVDVKPNVDARHPDYPFENSRENFKKRIDNDVKALTLYLGQIARGYEARDLQESFKDVVSMPRVEAGKDIAGVTEKLKKTFGQQGVAKPAEMKPLPQEVTVTADTVEDTKTKRILLDVKAKEEEKKKEASFKGEAAPKAVDFLIELKQDPKLPVFHNNTNVDYLEVGREYGEPEKFFAELGTLMVEMKEDLANSGMYGYEKLAPGNLFFGGISIDKQYGGVHIRVPYKAVFVNPFYNFGARTLFGVRETLLDTMIHEIAHTGSMDHGVAHNTQMVQVRQYLADEGMIDYYRDALGDILRRHESTFTAMKEVYGKSTTRNTAKSLEDYGKDAGEGAAGSYLYRGKYKPAVISTGEGRTGRENIPEAETAGREGGVGEGIGAAGFIRNVEPSLAEQMMDLVFGSENIRKEQIREYATLRRQMGRITKKVAEGEVSLDMQRTLTRMMQSARELQSDIRASKPRRDSPEQFLAKALKEFDDGNISREVLNVIETAYKKYPELLDGLLLRVRQGGRNRIAGNFDHFRRIISLFKGTSGVTKPATIRHEITHTLEQMMTPEQRMVVVQAWGKALAKAIKQNPDDIHQEYFNKVLDFLDRPTEASFAAAQEALPSYEMYQFLNPSEYWAVNAERLMAAQLGSAWEKFKRAVRQLFEGMKKVFGFDNTYDVHKVFNAVMKGSRERITRDMLIDLATSGGGKYVRLKNIEDEKQLMEKYNRPHTPMLNTKPLLTFITRQFSNGKEFFKDAVSNPKEAIVGAGDSVMDGLIYLRNKNVWYGAGLEARDFDKYNGELKTSEGIATASVALDNAIRSGNIGVEVIFRGGIEYDTRSNNFVAVKRDLGMKGVYEAEAKIKKRLGDQLGTDIIQGYLEAKRSISIRNEFYERDAAYENAKENYKAIKKIGTEQQIAQAENVRNEALRDLDAIKKAMSSVNMSEEEMSEFAAAEDRHPELRDIMTNWNAINQNMLRFWRQVGLLSQKRYEALSAIPDYVPWFRIMNDEEDVHSPLQSTTRTLTNIGREKLFKRGKPVSVVDFRAKEGQKDFKIQPSSVIRVEVNGKAVNPDLLSVTPDGDVHLDVDLQENDLVVFKTNREIENIIDNMTRNVMRMTMNGIRQFAASRIVMEYASRDPNGKIMEFPKADKEKGRFNWFVDGKKIVVEISDPLVAASIYGMENINLQMWKPLAMVANMTRRTITLSGVFQLKQVFKDAPTAALVTGVKNPLALIGGVWKGFLTSLTYTDPVVDILKSAGIGGFQSPARTPEADLKRRLGIMNRNVYDFVIHGLDHIGDAADMAQRVATYKRVLAETGDETQALFQAANVINFLHHGSAGYAQAIVKVTPFIGAWSNATDTLVRALVGGGLKGMDRIHGLGRLSVAATMLTSLILLYCMLAGADPEYDEIDDQTKLKNILIPGTKIMLPMNTSAAFFFKAIPELIYNQVTRAGTESAMDARRLRVALGEAARDMLLGPEPVPAGFKPVFEVAINHSFFTGRPVIPEGLKDVEAAEQYTSTTSELGKKLSEMTAIPKTEKRVISPIEADHLIRGIFGTAGATSQWISNSIGAMAEVRPEPSAKETPITGAFLREDVPRGREDLFYDFKEEVTKKYRTWNKMMERGDEKAADAYIAKYGDIASMYEYINEAEADLKEVNAEIRRIGETREKDMTPKERRQEIDELKRLRSDILDPVKELRLEAFGPAKGIKSLIPAD